jgi:hypothetical protein
MGNLSGKPQHHRLFGEKVAVIIRIDEKATPKETSGLSFME